VITLPPRFFDICRSCGIAELHSAPLPEVCPKCGKPWGHGRRLNNDDWQVRLMSAALERAQYRRPPTPAGQWLGLTDEDLDLCDRVRTAACSDRWHYTCVYRLATDLLNAHLNAERAQKTKSKTAFAAYRKRMLRDLSDFTSCLRSTGATAQLLHKAV
jgi:hypothetical protein